MLNCIVTLTAILLFAFALYVLSDINPSFTPLLSLAILVDVTVIFGMLNMLKAGVIFAYILAVGCFIIAVIKKKDNLAEKVKNFFTPGVILFIISSVAMLVFLSIKQPMMSEWDEFSFWGTSQKLLKIHDALYTFYRSSMIGNSTPPTLAVLTYLFGAFNPQFLEWVSFLAYDVMFFAAFSVFGAIFGKKQWHCGFITYLIGFLMPYFFEIYTRIIHLEPVYINTYADIPLGLIFGAAFRMYFHSDNGDKRDILPTLPVLMLLTLIKDMGFALGCIVLFCAFFDMLVSKKQFTFYRLKGFFAKIAAAFSMFAVTVASFLSWSIHMAKVMQRNPLELGGESNMGYVEMLTTGAKMLLGLMSPSEKFVEIKKEMIDAFLHTKICMIGPGIIVVAMLSVIFVLAFILGNKKSRIRTLVLYITSWIGFIGYYIFHLFLYVFIFKDNAYGLTSYNRYIYPYYIGWILMGVFALCYAIKESDGIKQLLSKCVLFGFAVCILFMFNRYSSYENLFIEYGEQSFATRKNVHTKAEYIRPAIEADDIIYLYSGYDNGERWFMYTFELAENYIPEDFGINPVGDTDEEIIQSAKQQLYDFFVKNGITNVLIDNSSADFCYYFADMFDVPMNDTGLDTVCYYSVNYTEDERLMRFEYVAGGYVYEK